MSVSVVLSVFMTRRICREWLLPLQEVQQRHGCKKGNPSGTSVLIHLRVAALDKDAAIAFALRLDANHHKSAETDILDWLMY